jgi:hypothetical protein
MAITLETLAVGDVNYISKHNNNYTVIKTAIDALQLSLTGASGSVINFPAFTLAILGSSVAKLDTEDAIASDGGGAILDISAGSIWVPSAGQVRTSAGASLDFTGQSTDTYYTHLDALGAYSFDQTAVDIVHTIAFTSPSTFTTITEPSSVWAYEEFEKAKTNTALGGATYQKMDNLFEALGGASNALHPVTITGSDVTLTTAEGLEHGAFNCTGTLTGDRDLIVPDFEKVYVVRNATSGSFDLGVRTSAQLTFPTVTQGSTALLICDGTDVLTFPMTAPPTLQPFVVAAWKNGIAGTNERVLGFTMPSGITGITLPASAANSSCEAEVAATAQTDFDLQKNGASIGTIRWAISGTVATFVGISETTFTGGDLLEIQAPGTADATLADHYFTLYFTRDL